MSATICDFLLFPTVQEFLTFDELLALQLINHTFHKRIHNGSACDGYWHNLCINYAKKYGLYHHSMRLDGDAAKQHLLGELLPLRHKWRLTEENKTSENFKVRTMCRFRPGSSCSGKVLLPLHQFLKLRRDKLAQQTENNGSCEDTRKECENALAKFGRSVPEEFLDPILGTTMKEPVLLTGLGASERVVDRSVAVQCMLHGGDPFTGVRLTTSMVVPQPELATRIREWTAANVDYDPSVDMADLKSLVDAGNEVNPQLLEALMEVQQLQAVSNKIYAQSRISTMGSHGVAAADPFHEELLANNSTESGVEAEIDPFNLDAPETPETTNENAVNGVDGASVAEATDGLPRQLRNARAADTAKIVDVNTNNAFVSMHIPGQGVKQFHYSRVFHEKGWSHKEKQTQGAADDPGSAPEGILPNVVQMLKPKRQNHNEQAFVYGHSARESVLATMNGYNACVLAYGQTGSGKTFSLFGDPVSTEKLYNKYVAAGTVVGAAVAVGAVQGAPPKAVVREPCEAEAEVFDARSVRLDDSAGMVVRCFLELLEAKSQLTQQQRMHVAITAQFVEIYNETVTDLMSGKSIYFRRDTGAPVGATTTPVETLQDVLWLLHTAQQRKKFAATAMNEHSSRSHTAVILTVDQAKPVATPMAARAPTGASAACYSAADDDGMAEEAATSSNSVVPAAAGAETLHCSSSLYLVDLAGSERVKKSKATGQRLGEAVGINKSLLVLGRVIGALVEGKAHVPYLESKLTTLLRQAFGGNCRTSVMVHCRPDEVHSEETLQSMRFGERCSMILNTTKIAATSKEATLATIDAALERMVKQLTSLKNNGKQHLDAFKKLTTSLGTLQQKRTEIESM